MRYLTLVGLALLYPAVVRAQSAPSAKAAIEAWIATKGFFPTPTYRQALADLDGDRRADLIVVLSGAPWCNENGCQMLIFRATAAGFEFLSDVANVRDPVRVSTERLNGWRTLITRSKDKKDVLLPFDGSKYPPDVNQAERANGAQVSEAMTVIKH